MQEELDNCIRTSTTIPDGLERELDVAIAKQEIEAVNFNAIADKIRTVEAIYIPRSYIRLYLNPI